MTDPTRTDEDEAGQAVGCCDPDDPATWCTGGRAAACRSRPPAAALPCGCQPADHAPAPAVERSRSLVQGTGLGMPAVFGNVGG